MVKGIYIGGNIMNKNNPICQEQEHIGFKEQTHEIIINYYI